MSVAIRLATEHDIAGMAALRAETWGTEPYWKTRIAGYMSGEDSPQHALPECVAFVAIEESKIVGLIAGHRTERFHYQGELEWIDVTEQWRGQRIADRLMSQMAAWFVEQKVVRVCVNVAPENAAAQGFYSRHGAVPLNEHWMAWEDVGIVTA